MAAYFGDVAVFAVAEFGIVVAGSGVGWGRRGRRSGRGCCVRGCRRCDGAGKVGDGFGIGVVGCENSERGGE